MNYAYYSKDFKSIKASSDNDKDKVDFVLPSKTAG